MASARHAVGNNRREQGFDGAEQGNGEGRPDQPDNIGKADFWRVEAGEGLRDTAENAADGANPLELENGLNQCDRHHGNEGTWNALEKFGREQKQCQAEKCQSGCCRMQCRECFDQMEELFVNVPRCRQVQVQRNLSIVRPR